LQEALVVLRIIRFFSNIGNPAIQEIRSANLPSAIGWQLTANGEKLVSLWILGFPSSGYPEFGFFDQLTYLLWALYHEPLLLLPLHCTFSKLVDINQY
jgi:hypothetical protein